MHDVVIVGGGPAGSTTALLLARAGYDVLLVDRAEFPREKACGDCISPGANGILKQLGVWEEVLAHLPAQLTGWQLNAGSAAFTTTFSDAGCETGLAIPRAAFDTVLLDAARAAGAVVRTGVQVTGLNADMSAVTTREDSISARFIVGADGLRSRVARAIDAYAERPRLRKVSLTAHLHGVPHTAGIGEMHMIGAVCLGIAPVDGGATPRCNVTVVQPAGEISSAGPQMLLRTTLERIGRRDIAGLVEEDTPVLASGPFDWPTRRVVLGRTLLTGDAGGYFDPFTGQGIYQALAGGVLAAEHISAALAHPARGQYELARYAERHRALVHSVHDVQRAVEFVCSRPRLARTVFSGLGRSASAARRLLAVTADTVPPQTLFSPGFLLTLAGNSAYSAFA